jgi:hypothetical protein
MSMKKTNARQYQRQRKRGSMVFMCVATFALIFLFIGLGFSAYNLFFAHEQLQNWSENIAATSAQQLNVNDHTGKLNNLIGHSRELVYASRQMYEQTQDDKNFAELEPLATQVLEQARAGAQEVSKERDRYAVTTLAKVRGIIKDAVEHPKQPIEILNLSANQFAISEVQLGCLTRAESNIEASRALADLYQFDAGKHFVRRYGKDTDLYRANIDLSLPAPDDDLHFRLSPMVAPVEGTTDPLHMIDGETFKGLVALRKHGEDASISNVVLPSAVQVVSTMRVEENIIGNMESVTSSTNTACANGACPEAH